MIDAQGLSKSIATDDAALALRDIERLSGAMISSDVRMAVEEHTDELWIVQHLHPLLSLMSVPWAGDELNNVFVLDRHGKELGVTWRAWGDVVASWANAQWFARPIGFGNVAHQRRDRRWEYLDFYMTTYFDYLIADYGVVLDALRQTIARKDQLYGLHLVAAPTEAG